MIIFPAGNCGADYNTINENRKLHVKKHEIQMCLVKQTLVKKKTYLHLQARHLSEYIEPQCGVTRPVCASAVCGCVRFGVYQGF